MRKHDERTGEDSSTTHAGNGTSDNESSRRRGSTANNRAELEDDNGGDINPFDWIVSVDFSKEELE
jgi:hypothetical protein